MICVFLNFFPFSFSENLAVSSSDSHEQHFFSSQGNNIFAGAPGNEVVDGLLGNIPSNRWYIARTFQV